MVFAVVFLGGTLTAQAGDWLISDESGQQWVVQSGIFRLGVPNRTRDVSKRGVMAYALRPSCCCLPCRMLLLVLAT